MVATNEVLRQQNQPQNTSKDTDISGQEWFKKLSPESQKKAQDLFVNLSELQKRADVLLATKKITGKSVESLNKALGRTAGAFNDPEASKTLTLLEKWKQDFAKASTEQTSVDQKIVALTTQLQALSGAIVEAEKTSTPNEKLKISPEQLGKISNAEFLSTPASERLRYISKGNIESADIASGKTKEVEFTFTFDGKKNQDLYMYTTAGQVLPKEVREVKTDGTLYVRQGLTGEFYNTESGKRLIVNDGTKLDIAKIGGPKELTELEQSNTEAYKKFVEGNKEYTDARYKSTIDTALEKGIEPKMMLVAAARRIEEYGDQPIKSSDLEDIATDIARSLSGAKRDNTGKYDVDTTARVLKNVNPTTWEDGMKKYGYSDDIIKEQSQKQSSNTKYNLDSINDFTPAEYSSPAEKSSEGTTLCSRTARLNLMRMGVDNPPQGGSAKASFDTYGKSAEAFPPSGKTDAKVADLYLDATPKNKQYGHRVAAFEKGGNWYVLDPYYAIPGIGRTRQPIPAEVYISAMENHYGKRIWGAHYYNQNPEAKKV